MFLKQEISFYTLQSNQNSQVYLCLWSNLMIHTIGDKSAFSEFQILYYVITQNKPIKYRNCVAFTVQKHPRATQAYKVQGPRLSCFRLLFLLLQKHSLLPLGLFASVLHPLSSASQTSGDDQSSSDPGNVLSHNHIILGFGGTIKPYG